MPDKPRITFNPGEPVIVTLKFDNGFKKEGANGPYFSHTVLHNNVDTLMFASPKLNDMITSDYGRGDTLRIIKHDTKPVTWGVHKEGEADVKTSLYALSSKPKIEAAKLDSSVSVPNSP